MGIVKKTKEVTVLEICITLREDEINNLRQIRDIDSEARAVWVLRKLYNMSFQESIDIIRTL